MRQIVTTRNGGVDVLRVEEKPDPTPKNGEVVIRVRAAGLNFADILARQGLYPDGPPKPCVMGYEVSGVVETLGEGVNSSLVGKPVVALTRFGGQSELVAVKATQIFDKPESLTFEQAAAIPVNYLAAYVLLLVMGSLHESESVLIHNAGGGVGLAALDIAKKIGAVSYGTASPSKHKFLLERGLDHAIDYRSHDWLPVLKELTEGRGVELVIDPLGGGHWKKSYAALRHTGRLGERHYSGGGRRLDQALRRSCVLLRTGWRSSSLHRREKEHWQGCPCAVGGRQLEVAGRLASTNEITVE